MTSGKKANKTVPMWIIAPWTLQVFLFIHTQGYVFIDFRERRGRGWEGGKEKRKGGKEREREKKDWCEKHRLVAFCTLTWDRTLNLLVHWTMFQPTELPGQGKLYSFWWIFKSTFQFLQKIEHLVAFWSVWYWIDTSIST